MNQTPDQVKIIRMVTLQQDVEYSISVKPYWLKKFISEYEENWGVSPSADDIYEALSTQGFTEVEEYRSTTDSYSWETRIEEQYA